MRNLRVYTLTKEEQANFDPVQFTENLRAAGFEFDNDRCPVKIKKPWDMVADTFGTIVYRQWDYPEAEDMQPIIDWLVGAKP